MVSETLLRGPAEPPTSLCIFPHLETWLRKAPARLLGSETGARAAAGAARSPEGSACARARSPERKRAHVRGVWSARLRTCTQRLRRCADPGAQACARARSPKAGVRTCADPGAKACARARRACARVQIPERRPAHVRGVWSAGLRACA